MTWDLVAKLGASSWLNVGISLGRLGIKKVDALAWLPTKLAEEAARAEKLARVSVEPD